MRVEITASCIIAFTALACGTPDRILPPEARAARAFRPIGDIQLLPSRQPVEVRKVRLVPDSKVLWGVQNALDAAGLDRSNLQVSVRKQVVTLRGTATTAQREAVEQAVTTTAGVAGVRNEIKVRP